MCVVLSSVKLAEFHRPWVSTELCRKQLPYLPNWIEMVTSKNSQTHRTVFRHTMHCYSRVTSSSSSSGMSATGRRLFATLSGINFILDAITTNTPQFLLELTTCRLVVVQVLLKLGNPEDDRMLITSLQHDNVTSSHANKDTAVIRPLVVWFVYYILFTI